MQITHGPNVFNEIYIDLWLYSVTITFYSQVNISAESSLFLKKNFSLLFMQWIVLGKMLSKGFNDLNDFNPNM